MKHPLLVLFAAAAVATAAAPARAQLAAPPPVGAPPAPIPPPGPALGTVDVAGAVALLSSYSSAAVIRTNANSAYMRVQTTGARAQTVYVSTRIEGYRAGPGRAVWSYADHLAGTLDAAVLQRLMEETDAVTTPLGAWAVSTRSDGTHWLVFESFLPLAASPALVQQVVNYVASRADSLEAELTSRDVY